MALEEILSELADRRAAFKVYREKVEEELRLKRIEMLGAEQASIEHIIVRAVANGATIGQIKKAYGTKDHRTIASIVTARSSEIEAVRKAAVEKKPATDWFTLDGDRALVELPTGAATFTWSEVDGLFMFTTDEPLWNDDFTIRNEAVALLDGKTEADTEQAAQLARAIRGTQG